MKKQIIIGIVCLAVVAAAVISFENSFLTVKISGISDGSVRFAYGDTDISEELSDADFKAILSMFNGKKLYRDNPSCGFSEDVSVHLNMTFCIACDECPVVCLTEKNQYFRLSDEENLLLREILTKYGFVFPCV